MNGRRRRKFPPVVREIAACVFCDGGAMVSFDAIASALDVDRGAGFRDPTLAEAALIVQGDKEGPPPSVLCAEHPALDALLEEAMT